MGLWFSYGSDRGLGVLDDILSQTSVLVLGIDFLKDLYGTLNWVGMKFWQGTCLYELVGFFDL